VSKKLATVARWQGTAGAYRLKAQSSSDSSAMPTIARNSSSRPFAWARTVAGARAVCRVAVYGTGKPFRHAKALRVHRVHEVLKVLKVLKVSE
jgi:hypothetical protein